MPTALKVILVLIFIALTYRLLMVLFVIALIIATLVMFYYVGSSIHMLLAYLKNQETLQEEKKWQRSQTILENQEK